MTHDDYYGEAQTERRKKFNHIINNIDMVLMNNIPEVDPSVYENWQGRDPIGNDECDMVDTADVEEMNQEFAHFCQTHDDYTNNDFECDKYEGDSEVYQWFAVNENDADFLKRHNQFVTYSDLLDTHFLAITHFGTGWDYVDSMVDDILGDK